VVIPGDRITGTAMLLSARDKASLWDGDRGTVAVVLADEGAALRLAPSSLDRCRQHGGACHRRALSLEM
jgi:hypothetical protein